MTYINNEPDELRFRNKNPVNIKCEFCDNSFKMLYKSAEKNRKKNGQHKCLVCSGQTLKPQNNPSFWSEEKRIEHSNKIKSSKAYYDSMQNRDMKGDKNPVFGKKFSEQTKKRMSLSRIGKIGSNATAWKGGKCSIVKRVKSIIHKRYDWYRKVYQRDGWKCVHCESKVKIDAHHKESINKIIKRLCETRDFIDDDEKMLWLIEQPEIIDIDLINGITLCRECHKKEHGKKWGSHEC